MKFLKGLGAFTKKKQAAKGFQPKKAPQRLSQQTFILEPLITPSGLVDSIDHAPHPLAVDLYVPPMPEGHLPGLDSVDIHDPNQIVAHASEPVSHPGDNNPDSGLHSDHVPASNTAEPYTGQADILASHTVETPVADHQLDPLPFIHTPSTVESHTEISPDLATTTAHLAPTFDSGVFTVGAKGEVSFNYLFDGGQYQGQVAMFNMEGMDKFVPGSAEFIHEAATRALSDSNLGHVVISDTTEAARFSGLLGEPQDWNAGEYQGVKTFSMDKGSTFGIMLVPNGTVQQVFDGNPECDVRPLFSMTMANPNEAFHVGQIADVNGHGNTFVMEDLRMDGGSDHDYNDMIFQIQGATGKAVHMDQVVDPSHDWRQTELGNALIEYAKPYVTPEAIEPIDAPNAITIPLENPDDALVLLPIDPGDTLPPAPPEPSHFEFPQSNQPLVGVIDTGFSANNPYIDYSHITLGHDYIDGDANPLLQPEEGIEHGTHVLGIIGATQDNDIMDGVNDQAPLWVSRAVGSGQWADSLVEFVDAAKASEQPNAVINLSFDLTQVFDRVDTTRYEFTLAEYAALEYAHQNQVLIVVAAGNDGGVMSALGQASQHFDNIITVGSAQNLDPSVAPAEGFERADYSNFGNSLDIVAEGGTSENPVLSTSGNDLGTMHGTSVAAAKVTGAVSQVWAANPELSYHQVVEILKLTATDLNIPNWDDQTGAGLLNMVAAVHLAQATTPEPYTSEAPPMPVTWTGEGMTRERTVDFKYPIKLESFSGGVGPTIGVNLRNSPKFSDRGSRNEPYKKTLNFDAWTWGEEGEDYWIKGRRDALWYRVAGTNYWVPSAYIAGYPPSKPPLLPPNQPEPIKGDRLNQLLGKSRLTVDEIAECRKLIAQLPESSRAPLYEKLQYKVPYFNQRDNASMENGKKIGDVMCNLTTLASCLTFLGVKNPQQNRQFEDVLEDTLRSNPSRYPNGTDARYYWDNLSKLATSFGVASSGTKRMPAFSSTDQQFFKTYIAKNWEPSLNQGQAIMASVSNTGAGHIIKVIDIDWNRGGIIVDDPYGTPNTSAPNGYKELNTQTRGSVNTQQGQDEGGIGNDNFWPWSYCAKVFGDTVYLLLG